MTSVISFRREPVWLLVLISVTLTHQNHVRDKRGYHFHQHELTSPGTTYELGQQTEWVGSNFPLYESEYQPRTLDLGYKNNLPSTYHIPVDNSVEKPISEPQEIVPPQSVGAGIIPQLPPPAIPVNAVASNVPSSSGAVFLGSGSLGVVQLSNGGYALGSGSLGYSGMRQNPRPTLRSPLYPPLPATPNLIPAAVLGSEPVQRPVLEYREPQQPPQYLRPAPSSLVPITGSPSFIDYNGNQLGLNGYEPIRPENVGFGAPLPPRRPKVRQNFATPTAVQPFPVASFKYDFSANPSLVPNNLNQFY